jgi:hypothetical protein
MWRYRIGLLMKLPHSSAYLPVQIDSPQHILKLLNQGRRDVLSIKNLL